MTTLSRGIVSVALFCWMYPAKRASGARGEKQCFVELQALLSSVTPISSPLPLNCSDIEACAPDWIASGFFARTILPPKKVRVPLKIDYGKQTVLTSRKTGMSNRGE